MNAPVYPLHRGVRRSLAHGIDLIYFSPIQLGDNRLVTPPNERVYVGMDVDTANDACILTSRLASSGCGIKVGPHFILDKNFSRYIDGLCDINNGRFWDLKHLDIPETVKAAVSNAASRNFTYATINARSRKVVQAAAAAAKHKTLKVLAVPLLTSDDEPFDSPVVRERIEWSVEAECHGLICSPQDVAQARKLIPTDWHVGTPGIVIDDFSRDHVRSGTPEQAIGDGATFIVLARYII